MQTFLCQVDLNKQQAKIGFLEISFHIRRDGGFSLSHYRNKTEDTDLERDWPLLMRAYQSIEKCINAYG